MANEYSLGEAYLELGVKGKENLEQKLRDTGKTIDDFRRKQAAALNVDMRATARATANASQPVAISPEQGQFLFSGGPARQQAYQQMIRDASAAAVRRERMAMDPDYAARQRIPLPMAGPGFDPRAEASERIAKLRQERAVRQEMEKLVPPLERFGMAMRGMGAGGRFALGMLGISGVAGAVAWTEKMMTADPKRVGTFNPLLQFQMEQMDRDITAVTERAAAPRTQQMIQRDRNYADWLAAQAKQDEREGWGPGMRAFKARTREWVGDWLPGARNVANVGSGESVGAGTNPMLGQFFSADQLYKAISTASLQTPYSGADATRDRDAQFQRAVEKLEQAADKLLAEKFAPGTGGGWRDVTPHTLR